MTTSSHSARAVWIALRTVKHFVSVVMQKKPNLKGNTMNAQTPNSNRIVIIHDTDADGTCAAWCIARGFKLSDEQMKLIPMRAGVFLPVSELELLPGDQVFIVDRAYPPGTVMEMLNIVENVTILDHHVTAQKEWHDFFRANTDKKDYVCVVVDPDGVSREVGPRLTYESAYHFGTPENSVKQVLDGCMVHTDVYGNDHTLLVKVDLNHSGCMLAYNYINEPDNTDFKLNPIGTWFVPYIEDRDLWEFNLFKSKEINSALYLMGHTFDVYDDLYERAVNPAFDVMWHSSTPAGYSSCYDAAIMQKGEAITEFNNKIIKTIATAANIEYFYMESLSGWELSALPCVLDDTHKHWFNADACKHYVAMLPCSFNLISDVADYILNTPPEEGDKVPDVVVCYSPVFEKNEQGVSVFQCYVYSMRSKHDISNFAKMLGGGGHPQACGFKCAVGPATVFDTYRD